MKILSDPLVAVVRERPAYPDTPPYHPSEEYPEWPGEPVAPGDDNPAYRGVREAFRALRLDAGRFGKAGWNPLGAMIGPEQTVVVKPNLVCHRNLGMRMGMTDTDSLITHGAVIRAVLDYAAKAMDGRGTLLVTDCPIQGTDWEAVGALAGLGRISDHFRSRWPGICLKVRDYRLGKAIMRGGAVVGRRFADPAHGEYVEVDLGPESLLLPLMEGSAEFGVMQYPRHRMRSSHTRESNRYLFPGAILRADAFINLPKMKTHMKAGLTGALKNLVGINGHKDYLPHFRYGSPKDGGDEYPDGNWFWDLAWRVTHAEWDLEWGARKRALIYAANGLPFLFPLLAGRPRGDYYAVMGGSWPGNDTLWRTILDINRAFLYADREGRVGDAPFEGRKYLVVVDGLVGGEGEGPLAPEPVRSGVILAGSNPVAIDAVAAAVMGFDWRRVAHVARAFERFPRPLAEFRPEEVRVSGPSGETRLEAVGAAQAAGRPFRATCSYRGHVEARGVSR